MISLVPSGSGSSVELGLQPFDGQYERQVKVQPYIGQSPPSPPISLFKDKSSTGEASFRIMSFLFME